MSETVIVGAARTPVGSFLGELSTFSATHLGALAIKGAIKNAGVKSKLVEEVLMGCVLPAGLGQAPARQASLGAGVPMHAPAVTVNKVCGSGMRTVTMAFDQIELGHSNLLVAGGMESMSNAPHLSRSLRKGTRLGHSNFEDHMFKDGLEDAYDEGRLMGTYAEDCAEKYQFSRIDQDDFAIKSLTRSVESQQNKYFENEIVKISKFDSSDEKVISEDEQPRLAQINKIPLLKPVFKEGGSVTAANSSSISDGAAALVLSSSKMAAENSLNIRAKIVGHSGFAHEPGWFTTAPIHASRKLLELVEWSKDDVDLWEVNEAFAVVALAFINELGIPIEKLNIRGGACALGHPIGASGTRIIVTLLNALEQLDLKRGIAAICLGGGEALAIAIERP